MDSVFVSSQQKIYYQNAKVKSQREKMKSREKLKIISQRVPYGSHTFYQTLLENLVGFHLPLKDRFESFGN